ncbi:MAG: hypothetical protein R3357_13560 [Burkholderiales bacterium]|nr:hypothetical protein [Burkholderiales bacterium]
MAAPPAARRAALDEFTAQQLHTIWQTQLCRYVAEAGGDDTAVLAELKRLRAPDVLRPARLRFGVLDVEAGGQRWDVQGVLAGTQRDGPFLRYVFVVGVVGHDAYLSSAVRDLRVVSLAPVAGTLVWETSAADAESVQRYRAVFDAGAGRFPARDDDFALQASSTRVAVREMRSGTDWSLALRADLRDLRGARVSYARHAPRDAGDDACTPREALH